jgi:hypothetical protein
VNIDKVKIQRKLKVLEILLDIYYYNQIYYWSNNENQDCRKMCYVTFVSILPVLIEESRGPKHNQPILSKALHPSSFHCCLSQDPPHVSCSCLLSLVRGCANCCGVVCPRKLFERESPFDQGATTTRSLFVPLFSALPCIERYNLGALSFYIFHSQPLTCLRCESRKKCRWMA